MVQKQQKEAREANWNVVPKAGMDNSATERAKQIILDAGKHSDYY
jgi:hypothetical protein